MFSAFIAGLESLESMLVEAEYMANRGIVPAFSDWMPVPGIDAGSHVSMCRDIYRNMDDILALV